MIAGAPNGTFRRGHRPAIELFSLGASLDAPAVLDLAGRAARGPWKEAAAILLAALSRREKVDAALFSELVRDVSALQAFVRALLERGPMGRGVELARAWLERRPIEEIVPVHGKPSLGDIVRLVHPRPDSAEHEALYGWLVGAPHDASRLPARSFFSRAPSTMGDARVVVLPDVSGSMRGRATRGGASCLEVAADVIAGLRPRLVVPWSERTFKFTGDLVSLAGGSACPRLPLGELVHREVAADLVVYVSDHESWLDPRGRAVHALSWGRWRLERSWVLEAWERFRERNPRAKLACIDLRPRLEGAPIDRPDVLSIEGWDETVPALLGAFARGELG